MQVDVGRARAYAERLLAGQGDRWAHARAAARRAEEIARVVGPLDRDLLLCAAWLHDVGYAPELQRTGFHPLDGALHLAEAGWPERLCGLVAHHSEARLTAAPMGLTRELERFGREEGAVADALVHADMASGPRGERMSLAERLDDIERRHLEDPPAVQQARSASRLAIVQAVERTEHRLAGPPPGGQTVG